jgi:hypothetical protein
MENIIKLWKELNVENVNFNFSCGGDSMNDTDIEIIDKEGNFVESDELIDYFDNEVYRKVDFYVNSDGHYIGESGSVYITLDEDDDEPYFNYSKSAQSEWSEMSTETTTITLNDKESKFIVDYVSNINGGSDNGVINYKKDFILTDEEETIATDLLDKITEFARDFEPENINGEAEDWFSFTTNDVGEELTLVDNELTITIQQSYITYSDSD